jgi:monolysocardiolipin acyltransferase
VNQHPHNQLRYFKWGISRLILESEPAPHLVPIFIDGMQNIMPEHRKWPRWLPRTGANVRIVFGERVDTGEMFSEYRHLWRQLARNYKIAGSVDNHFTLGELPDELKMDPMAVGMRIAIANETRTMVAQLRESLGLPPDDPSLGLAKSWQIQGTK